MPLTRLLARAGVRRDEHVSVARDFSIYSGVNILSLVLLLGTGLILRRYLGPYLAGIWAGLEVLPAYAQYAHFGALNAAERDLPYLLGAGRDDEFERMKDTLLWLSHGLGLALALALAVGAFATRGRFSDAFFIGLLVYAPLLWTQIVSAYYVVLYRARKRFVQLSARQGIANLGKAALTMGGGYAFGLYGVFGGLLVASAAQLVLLHSGLDERFHRTFRASLLPPMLVDGIPMLAGAVAFETVRNADRIVVGLVLGAEALGVYSVTQIVCQGMFYLPNALSLVMFPRFQERFGRTQDPASLRQFVELPLSVLANALLAATLVLIVVLPPAITRVLPQFVDTIQPLRVMLVATYLLCLTLPAGQFLLTVRKQNQALLIGAPGTLIALAAAYLGAAHGLVGVAFGVAAACVYEFVAVNLYALADLAGWRAAATRVGAIGATAAAGVAVVLGFERVLPPGPSFVALVGGWSLLPAGIVAAGLLARAARQVSDGARIG